MNYHFMEFLLSYESWLTTREIERVREREREREKEKKKDVKILTHAVFVGRSTSIKVRQCQQLGPHHSVLGFSFDK